MRTCLLIALVVVGGCAAKPEPLGPQPTAVLGPELSAPQVKSEIVGNTGTGRRTGSNAQLSMYVAPDGKLLVKGIGGTDAGQWRIADDGQWCTSLPNAASRGGEVCQKVHKAGIAIQFASPSSVEEMTFLPGNKL
jgi:hypothetical protein